MKFPIQLLVLVPVFAYAGETVLQDDVFTTKKPGLAPASTKKQ